MSTADARIAPYVKLSRAQDEALTVLVKAAEKPGGGRVRGSKRRSTLDPPNVNMIAGGSLVRLLLARRIMPDFERGYRIDFTATSVMVCTDEFEVSAAGVAVWADARGADG